MTEVDHPIHRPVLSQEIVHLLGLRPGGVVVDGTVGLGGHAEALLQAEPEVTVIGIDRDEEALRHAANRLSPFKERVRLIHGNYRDLGEHLDVLGIDTITGFLLDLGLSS
ncbi:16S rRNA (cytosine(1402)-N(4))-methyltransferase, partial [Candidatus Bipolaricaulota bacterium]|nr:16S rRNA (cytosine(1402)-N(4))-methyltransferase [Candidatus Bipolaricaulota bacterium]